MFKKLCIMALTLFIVQTGQAQELNIPAQRAQASHPLTEEPIAVEVGRSYWYGFLTGSATGLAGSVLSAVMIQNWDLNAPTSGLMFGMPIGMIAGSARGVVGWDDSVDEKALLAARIGAATPVLIGGVLGRLIVNNPTKGMRNGAFTGQFLAPFGAMLGYRLYRTVFSKQASVTPQAASIAPVRHPVMPRHVSLLDERPQEDFIFQLIAMTF